MVRRCDLAAPLVLILRTGLRKELYLATLQKFKIFSLLKISLIQGVLIKKYTILIFSAMYFSLTCGKHCVCLFVYIPLKKTAVQLVLSEFLSYSVSFAIQTLSERQ